MFNQVDDLLHEIKVCTEFVFPTCSNGVNDMFEPVKWDYNAYAAGCVDQFGIKPRPEWSTVYYGGKKIESHTNIIFSNGS